jgi:hypothetical protein
MDNYVLIYFGDETPETEAEHHAAMARRMNWFGSLAVSVVDVGNPIRPISIISAGGKIT